MNAILHKLFHVFVHGFPGWLLKIIYLWLLVSTFETVLRSSSDQKVQNDAQAPHIGHFCTIFSIRLNFRSAKKSINAAYLLFIHLEFFGYINQLHHGNIGDLNLDWQLIDMQAMIDDHMLRAQIFVHDFVLVQVLDLLNNLTCDLRNFWDCELRS